MADNSSANSRNDTNQFSEGDEPWAKSSEWKWMCEHWNLIDDLMDGTMAMRSTGEKWLPREPKESQDKYDNRVRRSFLDNGYKRSLKNIAAKPFSHPIKVEGNLPESLTEMDDDVDRRGTNLNAFAQDFFQEAIHRGIAHIFIDFPKVEEGVTLKEERDEGIRPYWVMVSAKDLIGWRTKKLDNGRVVLTQIRFIERASIDSGNYNSKSVDRVRVVNAPVNNELGTFEVWEEKVGAGGTKNSWEKVDFGTHTFPGIPLATCYIEEQEDFFVAKPAMEELGYTNLAHWQSYSDQRNILRFARTGALATFGMEQEEVNKIVWGSDQILSAGSNEARIEILEYQGKSIEHGRADLKDLEQKMEILGLSPFIDKARATATEVISENVQSETVIQSWIRRVEAAMRWAYGISAVWIKAELEKEFKINIFSDFGVTAMSSEDVKLLLEMRQARELGYPTFIKELKRRALLNEDVDPELEQAALEEEEDNALARGGDPTADLLIGNEEE